MWDDCKPIAACLLLLLGWFLYVPTMIQAEQLPIKTYTTADGLPRDNINRIVRDTRGFLWFCTEEGLSRFDGYQFTNYTTDQGLPNRRVSYLLEARDGAYWVGTGAGVCRFNPTGAPRFIVYQPGVTEESRQVEALVQDRSGVIWCATHAGVYRLDEGAGGVQLEHIEMGMPRGGQGDFVQVLVADQQGSLWAGTVENGLYRRFSDGRVEQFTTKNGLPDRRIEALLEDRDGRMWVATPHGLCQLVQAPDPSRPVVARLYTTRDGLVQDWVASIFQSADGKLWIGDGGLSEFLPSPDEAVRHFRTHTTAQGLSSPNIETIAEDRDRSLWIGTYGGGAMKLVRNGFTTYTRDDGLGALGVDSIFEDRAGEICVISSGTKHLINRFDGRRFTAIWPDFPKQIKNYGWGWNQVTFQDRNGEWWCPTGDGLCRFPAVSSVDQLAHTPPRAVYNTRTGLPFNDIFRLYQDSHADVWIGGQGLSRWERTTGKLHNFSEADGLEPRMPSAFGEDSAGSLWIGHWAGGLSRYSRGRFAFFSEAEGLPAGTIRTVYLDHAHRIWIATARGGLARLDDPAADRPHFVTYTTAEGLSSNEILCITEDPWGHIYVGTGRALDRLDPDTGQIKHYTTADGLVRGNVTAAFRDSRGVLWFGSDINGLSRLVPEPDPPMPPPPILISGLRIGGVAYPVSQLGETDVPRLDLRPSQNQLNIDFVGLSFGPGEALRYQYRLEGADKDWSPPGVERSVNYANLAPGQYRFLVRAVNPEGLPSVAAATVTFTILPPVWRRWWFLALAATMIGLAIYAAHRSRVARLVELERVRTRIAIDLHDDIGANLSLVAMLSEVARGHLQRDDERLKEWFSTIASTSRDTVDAMSDIVWAINPKRDQLRDLTQRMRRFADDILAARNIEFDFRAPESARDLKIGADLRREIFLIFKESINNVARHSSCTGAGVDLQIERGWFVLQISDNGCGLDHKGNGSGNGLASMRLRAEKLGGSLELTSRNGHGTSVTLRVPLGHRSRSWLD